MHGDTGASTAEYGLVALAIAATVSAALFLLGGPVVELFSDSCHAVAAGAGSAVACP